MEILIKALAIAPRWARGQAWGIYGFALGFRHTGDITQPELARKLTHYFLNCLPEDFVCHWDLIFTPQDNALRDTQPLRSQPAASQSC